MRTSTLWTGLFCGALLAGCGGDDTGTGGTGGTTATGGTGGSTSTGGTGGSTSTGGSGGSTGGTGGVVGGPFSSKGTTTYETQTSIAADQNGNLVAVWIGFSANGDSGVGYAVSHDGGAHWTEPRLAATPGGRFASNPTVVADKQGRFTVAWLGFKVDFANPDEHVFVARLDGATDMLGTPLIASDDDGGTTYDLDKPEIKVDATDALLLTWADFTGSGAGTPASLKFARSTDAQTWNRVTVTNDATFGNLASLCLDTSAGAGATLYMVHLGANATVTLRTSVNQGQSWELRPTPAASVVFQDPTCVVKGTELHIAYAAGSAVFTPGEDSPGDSIYVMRSGNGGTTFDAPVKVSSDAKLYLYPRLARAASGKLHILYYEGDGDGQPASVALSSSTNGAAWTASPVADAGTFTVDRTIASWLGAYVGFATNGAKGYATFAENSSNVSHIAFAEIGLP